MATRTRAGGAEERRVGADFDNGVAGDGAVDDNNLRIIALDSGSELVESGDPGYGATRTAGRAEV